MGSEKKDWRGHIDVTDIDPRLMIQTAYNGSRPQGLGLLHYVPGDLDEATLDEIMERAEKDDPRGHVHIDYLRGRSMKFHIWNDRDAGRRYFNLDWYDHGRAATADLLSRVGLPDVEAKIEQATREKDDLAREWDERQTAAARSLITIAASGDEFFGNQQGEVFANYHRLPEGDPIKEAWTHGYETAILNGWIAYVEERRAYTLTPAGRLALQEAGDGKA